MTTEPTTPAQAGQRLTESELEDIEIGARRGNLANAVTTLLLLDNLRAARAERDELRRVVREAVEAMREACNQTGTLTGVLNVGHAAQWVFRDDYDGPNAVNDHIARVRDALASLAAKGAGE